MGAEVAREIQEFYGGKVGGGDPFEDLLVGRIGRLGRPPVLADQRLDRRPVDDPSTQRGALRADGHDRKQRLLRPLHATLGEDRFERLDEGRIHIIPTLRENAEERPSQCLKLLRPIDQSSIPQDGACTVLRAARSNRLEERTLIVTLNILVNRDQIACEGAVDYVHAQLPPGKGAVQNRVYVAGGKMTDA